MRFANGDVYVGNWKADKMHGEGILKFSDGNSIDGSWKMD